MKHLVCKEEDLALGEQLATKAGEEKILIFHLDDGFYATQLKCTHLFMSLKKGKIIEGKRVQCPIHRAEFDIKTGEVCKWANFPPGVQLFNGLRKEKALKTFPVSVADGEVFVEV